jgi:hypothetical protein
MAVNMGGAQMHRLLRDLFIPRRANILSRSRGAISSGPCHAAMAWALRRNRLLAVLCLVGLSLASASPAARAQSSADVSGSVVSLNPAYKGDAVAEIHMMNHPTNGPQDNGVFPLSLPWLRLEAEFIWQHTPEGHDAVRVSPPKGIFCVPLDCTLIVPESNSGTMQLFVLQDLVG